MFNLKSAIDSSANLGEFVGQVLTDQTQALVAYAHPCGGHVLQVVPVEQARGLVTVREDVVAILEWHRISQYADYPVQFDSASAVLI